MTPKKDPKDKGKEKNKDKDSGVAEGLSRPKRTFDAVKEDLIAAAAGAPISAVPKNLESGTTGSPARKKRKSLEDEPASTTTEKPAVRFNVQETEKAKVARDDDPFAPSKPSTPAPTPAQASKITTTTPTESDAMDVDAEADDVDMPNIGMKDFLSMIGISFMDGITSTRHRRQTGAILGLAVDMPEEEISIADQITGQLTIRPFLELYEHVSLFCHWKRNGEWIGD